MASSHRPLRPSEWQPDDSANNCGICKRYFGFLRRRHHCRACGALLCDTCTPHRMFVGGYAERERVCILCCNARAQSEVPIATKVLSIQDPVPSAPQLTASLPLHRTPEASTKGCPSTVVETVSTTGETETERLKNPTIGTRIGPQSSGTINLSNGWALSLTGVCPRTQRNRWTMCPTPFTNSISSRKGKDDTSLSAPPAPYVDLLIVEGVDLILNFDSAWLSGEIRILDGACWLPTARKITFNGN